MADKIRFLTGSLTDLENKSISRGEVYFAIDGDKGKILFDAPINQTTTKRILMGGDSEHADQAEEAKYALYDKGGKDIRTYVASISLDTPGTSLIVKNGKGDTLSTLSPKFLPLTGGKITGELYTDSLTTGDLLVNGSARFVNTILGNIETADKWKTARNFITNLGSTSKAKVDGSQAEYNIGITGILPVTNGGTGKNNGKDAANYFLNSLTTGSSNPVDNDYYISQYVNGGTTTTTFHRRPMSALWGYIKTKIKDVLILDETSYNGNAATADKWKNKSNFITNLGSTTKASVDGSQAEYNIGITGTLPIENGGTGATTAAKARENLSTLAALKPSGQSYYVMAAPDGSDNVWIRTTSQGLLPYQRGAAGSGHGNIGTSSWYFKDAYIDNIYGNAASATKLKTARKIITALNSESGGSFDGSADVTIGVSGTLPVSHGGTGVTSVANIQAGKDGDGNTISSTYLKLSGGTMTGNISYKGTNATNSMIRFIDNTTDTSGNGISIGGGGVTVIGAGESSQNLTPAANEESLYLLSDGSIKFYTYCDTIGNKRGVILDTSRNFYPDANNNGSVGTSSNKWASMYASTFYGNLSGTASYATRDSNGQIITDTYLTNVYVSDTTKLYKTIGTSGDSNKNILIGSFTPLDADGLINIKYLPQGALERMHIVANKAARLALTTANVQKGDTVYEDDTGSMYYVYDDTKLNSEDGYRLYSAGTATRVNWSGVQNRPHVLGSSSQTNVISLDAAKTTFTIRVVEKTGTESSYTLTPNFLPLTGGTITGELYVDGGATLASLLVNGDARFVNTIQGSISGNAGSATKWATEKAFYIADAEAKHTSSPQVNIDGSKSSYTLHLPSTIKATLEGNASSATKLTNLTTADQASSTNTWRRVWFSYDDNVNGRPSYSDTFAYQSSTGTVKATKFQGALAGNATSADKWSTARNFITNLGSESSASVDGSTGPYNIGVSGVLPVSHGGTGVTSIAEIKAGKDADGNTITSKYVSIYNSNNIGSSADVTVNDLAKQGSAVGMIHAATDNPFSKASWVHVWSQAWNKTVNTSWVSQIALGVDESDGMWYRTKEGTIVGASWTRVIDSNNYNDYAVKKASSSTDNALVRWDGITGQAIQNSTALLSDEGDLTIRGKINSQGDITIGSMNGDTVVGAGNFKIGVKNDNYGVMPYANNWNSIGASNLYWYRAYIYNYYGTTAHITNYDSNGNIGTAATTNAASTLGYINFYNTTAAGTTQTKTKLTANSDATTNLTITLPKTDGMLLNEGNYNDFAVKKASSSSDNAIVRWDGIEGNRIQNSLLSINDEGLLTLQIGNHIGAKLGSAYITSANSSNGEIVLQNGHLRFGSDSWDYNQWAGLMYVHSSKIIYLGLADGTTFHANSAQSGGTLALPGIRYFSINGKIAIDANDGWLRINEGKAFSTGIYFGSNVVRTDGQLQVGDSGNKFYANSSGNGYFSNTLGIGGTNTSYKLYVNGTSYLNGNLTINSSGKVKIENATDSTYSEDTNAALDIKGGVSVDKQMSAKSVRIDNNSKDKGCTLIMNLDLNCLEFVFN